MKLFTRKKIITSTAALLAAMGIPAPFLERLYGDEVDLPLTRVMNLPVIEESDGMRALEVTTSSSTGKYYYLNSTAFEIWELIDGRRGQKEIVRIISERYSISRDEASEAVSSLIDSMKEQSLIF